MGDIALRVENLSKRYTVAAIRYRHDTLRDEFMDGLKSALRRRGPHNADRDTFWALQDISFEVRQGEVVGIVGRNGAGKSTLLKILCRVTEPTTGRAEMYGRVGSLLEVGTGFDRELSGRENIYLSGAILGMRKADISRKFDEIVAFAEVEKFVDTPVKRYSSGMYLRLAFAVAAHLEPEILLVDEVLAVGDATFQKKCLGKMGEVSRSGRTILFVSHNMGAILGLCSSCMWLDSGRLKSLGYPSDVVSSYLQSDAQHKPHREWSVVEAPGDDYLRLLSVTICQPPGVPCANVDITKAVEIVIEAEVATPNPETSVGLRISTSEGQTVLHTTSVLNPRQRIDRPGRWRFLCSLPSYTLNAGTYLLSVGSDIPHVRSILFQENVLTWTVEFSCPLMGRYNSRAWPGIIGPALAQWTLSPDAIALRT